MIEFKKVSQPKIPQPPKCIVRTLQKRMADDMRELAFADRPVNEETLRERGWTKDIVKRLGPVASAIARRDSTRQVA